MVSPTTATYAMRRRVSLSKAEWQHRRLHESRHGSLSSPSPHSSLPATPTDSAYASTPPESNSATTLAEHRHPNSTAEPEVQHLSFYDARTGIVGRATTETITTTTATTSTTAKWSRRGDGRTTVTITTSPYSDQSLSRNSSVSTQTSSSAPTTPQRHSMHSSISSTSSSSTSYTAPPSRSGSVHCRPPISRSNSVASAGPNEHHCYRGWPFPTKSELYRSNSAHHQEHFQLEHGASFDLKQGNLYSPLHDDNNDYNNNLYSPHSPHQPSYPLPPAHAPATSPPSRRHSKTQQFSPTKVNQPTKSKPLQQPPPTTTHPTPASPTTTPSSSSSSSDMIRRNSLKRLPASFCPESSGGSASKSGIRRNRPGSTSLTRILKPKAVAGGMAEYY